MAGKLEPLPGTGDIWEPEISGWVFLEQTARDLCTRYGYGELRPPIFERTEVFVRGIGDQTDVVQKEMYTFEDRGGRSLTLRPEGTAGVMRAIANQGLAQGEEKRVFYMGPMFRGERPAAGRRRQFHQFGVEAVGKVSPGVDAECIALLMDYLKAIGIEDGRLLINTRGEASDRKPVEEAMVAHFEPHAETMCEDCRRRLHTNVWRILDCKNDSCQEIIGRAPRMVDLLGAESQAYFKEVCRILDALGVIYEVDPRLVRGLDYYEHTVFEVVHDGLGAQSAVAGGGRYAIELSSVKKPIQGVGFAAGMERLLLARESLGCQDVAPKSVQVAVASLGEAALIPGMKLAQRLRAEGFSVSVETETRSLKAQMRNANRLGVKLVLIQGETELAEGTVLCKVMETSDQETVPVAEIVAWLKAHLQNG
jgi:histidyl-tRNA synthetase